MPGHLTKEEIIRSLESASKEFSSYCSQIPEDGFFKQPADKWSIAQNEPHLVSSAHMTRLAFRLPKFIVRMYTGKPNRPSRSFNELVAKYKTKLAQGGKASGRYIPKPVSPKPGKEKIMLDFSRSMELLGKDIQKKWKDPQLDKYLAPHPLLGKITLRELGYFTIYHTIHHQEIIKDRVNH